MRQLINFQMTEHFAKSLYHARSINEKQWEAMPEEKREHSFSVRYLLNWNALTHSTHYVLALGGTKNLAMRIIAYLHLSTSRYHVPQTHI